MIIGTSNPAPDSTPRPRRRWRPTFSLRTFLIGSTLASLGIWGFVSWYWPGERNEETLPGGIVHRQGIKMIQPEDPSAEPHAIAHGRFELLDRHGRMLSRGEYKDRVASGRWTHYHLDGRPALVGTCRDGLITGKLLAYDERGRKWLEVAYETRPERPAALPNRKATIQTVREGPSRQWWPSGKPQAEGALRADLREGPWTFWDEKGRKTAEGPYQAGLAHGDWTHYDPAGKPRPVWYWAGREIPRRDKLLDTLREQLQSGDRDARFDAVDGLGQLGSAAAPLLAQVLATDDMPLVLSALRALAAMGPYSQAALPAIARLRQASDREVRGEALVALFILDEPNRTALFRDLLLLTDPSHPAACDSWHSRLADLGQPALPSLEMLLNDPDSNVRLWSVDVLLWMVYPSRIGPRYQYHAPPYEEVDRLLTKAAQDNDPRVSLPAREYTKLEASRNQMIGTRMGGFVPIAPSKRGPKGGSFD